MSSARPLVPLLVAVALLPLAGAQPQAPYADRLFDTHMHADEASFGARMIGPMQAQAVDRAVLFVHMDPDDPAESHETLREELAGHPGRFVLFFHVDPKAPADIGPHRLENARSFAPDDFRGFGETALYRPPWQDQALDQEPWPSVFEWAAANGMIVMIHLRMGQLPELERMLEAHPQTSVLLHGPEFPRELPAMLSAHTNLRFTLDTASLLMLDGSAPQNLMYPAGDGGRDEFVAAYDAHRAELLQHALDTWSPVVAAAPDRVLWGTDVSMDWHADPDVYARLVDLSRAFISGLPADVRAGYAWDNAESLLGAGATLAPIQRDGDEDLPAIHAATALVGVLMLAAAVRRRSR